MLLLRQAIRAGESRQHHPAGSVLFCLVTSPVFRNIILGTLPWQRACDTRRLGTYYCMWSQLKGKKLAGISVLFALLFNYPIISIFSQSGYIWGVPRLYASIFMIWLLMILLLILLLDTRDTSHRAS